MVVVFSVNRAVYDTTVDYLRNARMTRYRVQTVETHTHGTV